MGLAGGDARARRPYVRVMNCDVRERGGTGVNALESSALCGCSSVDGVAMRCRPTGPCHAARPNREGPAETETAAAWRMLNAAWEATRGARAVAPFRPGGTHGPNGVGTISAQRGRRALPSSSARCGLPAGSLPRHGHTACAPTRAPKAPPLARIAAAGPANGPERRPRAAPAPPSPQHNAAAAAAAAAAARCA